MKVIGLTGGIGSGKSTVAALLAELGARVIDADRVGHDVYRPGTPGWERVVEAFGREVVSADGTIDRAKLGARVFADPVALATLNGIVHPLIWRELEARVAAARAAGGEAPVVIEAAILLESGWRSLADTIWAVIAPRRTVIDRVQRQRGLVPADVEARIAAQTDDETRRRMADVVIENDGSLEELGAAVRAAWARTVAA
jgi:dephospho-CoA kinase